MASLKCASVAEEISQIQVSLGKPNCKVIKNVGEFTHVITIKLEEEEVSIKFQVGASYPTVAPGIAVLSNMLTKDGCGDLTNKLTARSIQLQCQPMLQTLIDQARNFVRSIKESDTCGAAVSPMAPQQKIQHEPLQQRHTRRNKDVKGKKQKRRRKKEEDDVDEKLASMKTSEDVISRILWDDSLDMEDFIIGYLDRFVGIVEKNFTAFSWEDIASVDWSTLAIPKHRIQHFKYRNEVVWDKNLRLDNVFGSTGSGKTIHDVIADYKEEQFADADEGTNYSDSDDDDNINVYVGEQTFQDHVAEDYSDADKLVGKDAYWGPKSRPTHFLCLRITDPQIIHNVTEAQETITSIEENYNDCLIPPERLHITLCCLGLDTEENIEHAAETLRRIQPELKELHPEDINISLNGVNNFFHNVLYAQVEENPVFIDFVNHMKLCMQEAGIEIRDMFEFTPHMTIMKLSRDWGREQGTRYLDSRLYDALEGTYFGQENLNNIHLCKMSKEIENGFYICPTNISF